MNNPNCNPQKKPGLVQTLTDKIKDAIPEKAKDWFRKNGYLLLCMLIPAAVMYLIYLAREIHPFGNGCVLVLDLNGQYVWFFEALRNAVWGDMSMLYTFCRQLGGEFLGIYAYYIASPLSYIVCLFPKDKMLEALLTLFLIKVGISGGTFGYYMHKTMKERKPFAVVAFAILYALSSYAVVQQHNTMWIDAVMWLPLITLGIESLIKHGKYKLYTGFLALTLFSNFYIGYMVCIYCFLYFFVYYIGNAEENRNNPLCEKHHFFKSLFRIAFFSAVAVGIAALILLGAYYSLNFGKTTFSSPKWEWNLKFDILELLYKFLPGSYDTVRPAGYPFVYCGVLTLLLLPAYFLSSKHSMLQKITSGVFILLFIASFSFTVTDLIWHGFQAPNWLNYRYSFMLCFYLCVLSCRAFAEFERISLKSVAATAGLIALLCVYLQKFNDEAYVNPDDLTCIWFTLLTLFIYLAVLGILRKTTDVVNKQVVSIALIGLICAETLLNGLWNLNALDEDVGYSRYSYYNDFLNKTRPIVETVQEADDSFYRMEKTFFRKTNDNMALNMRGLSGSTSTLNKETIQFLNKMGYSSKSHWSKYLGGTPVNDSLLGLKYIISDQDVYESYYEVFKTDDKHGYTAYYNPYALSIAYGVDDDLLDFPLGYTNEVEDETDTVDGEKKENASQVGKFVTKLKSKLNKILGIEETMTDSEYVDVYYSPFERINGIVTAMLGAEKEQKVFVPIPVEDSYTTNLTIEHVLRHLRYEETDENFDGVLTYNIHVPVSGEIYFYLPTEYAREIRLSLFSSETGEDAVDMGTFNANETSRIISLGYHEAGSFLSLDMTITTAYFYVMNNQNCFYYIDYDAFGEAINTLRKDQFLIEDYTEKELNGSFTASKEHELVMSTIAYDRGWKIYVDGEEVEPVKALGSVIAFYVDGDAGETHDLRMVYAPATFYIGLAIMLISLFLFLLLIVLERYLKKVPVLRALVSVIPGEPAEEDETEPDEIAEPASSLPDAPPAEPAQAEEPNEGDAKSEEPNEDGAKPDEEPAQAEESEANPDGAPDETSEKE